MALLVVPGWIYFAGKASVEKGYEWKFCEGAGEAEAFPVHQQHAYGAKGSTGFVSLQLHKLMGSYV